jgi:putative ABC transport system permease protein
MAIPLAYNLRNLVVRKTTTLMTALGIALTVAVLISILALVNGLRTSLTAAASPLNILLVRKGSESELVSSFPRTVFQDVKFKPGIARGKDGQPLASVEAVFIVNLPTQSNPNGNNITVRGFTAAGLEMRDGIRISTGRMFQTGRREVIVGKDVAAGYPDARLGKTLRFGRGEWEIVGIFDAGRSASNSEIFVDLNQVGADFQRTDLVNSIHVRALDSVAAAALINDLSSDQRLNVAAFSEKDYYDKQTASSRPVEFIGIFVSVIMAIGSGFAAVNTMYAAVARRAREIGTLRVLGFSRGSILLSFFVESVLLSALGGVLGCLLTLPLNGVSAEVSNSVTFAQTGFDFRVGPDIMLIGVGFAVVLGAVGGLFPARLAAKKEILSALREV